MLCDCFVREYFKILKLPTSKFSDETMLLINILCPYIVYLSYNMETCVRQGFHLIFKMLQMYLYVVDSQSRSVQQMETSFLETFKMPNEIMKQ